MTDNEDAWAADENRPHKAVDAGLPNRAARVDGHTAVKRDADGTIHVQHFGAEHVVAETEVYLEPGETLVIRHIAPRA